jgi:ketosteroid isomerase-like protein
MTTAVSPVDRLLAIEDIKAVCNRYALGLDRFDIDLIVDCFTPDAVFDASPFELGSYTGHDEIRGFFKHNIDVMTTQMHLYSNFIIDVESAEAASGTNYLLEEGFNTDGQLIRCLGLDEDTYVRAADGWRIKSRIIHPLIAPALEGYKESL